MVLALPVQNRIIFKFHEELDDSGYFESDIL